jgi:O-antigen/teichoic acid export membrane protein
LGPPRRLSARAFWGLASWVLPLGVVFVVSPKLLHLLGAERFGVLMIALVTPLVASQLDFGINSAAVRRLAARFHVGQVDAGTTLFTLFICLLIIGLALAAVVWAAAGPVSAALGFAETLGPVQGPELVMACAVWVALSLASLVPGIVARAAQALILISIVQTLSTLALWVGAWVLLKQGSPLVSIVELGLVLTLIAAGATLVALRRRIDWSSPLRFAPELLTEDARYSAGMFAAQTAGALVNQGDRMLVAALGSPAMAGLYALCVNIANKTVAAVVAITSFVFPHVAGLQSAGQQDATIGLVHALDRAIAALLVPVLVPGLLLAGTFLRLWLGDFATPELVVAFRILMIAFAILAFAVPISNVLVASGKSGMSARYSWLTVAVVFGSMSFTVPRFGLIGAAGAILLGYSTSLVFAARARRALGIPPAARRGRFWLGLVVGCIAQVALLATLGPHVTGWLGLFALGAAAWATFYLVRTLAAMLTPEEEEFLQRFFAATLPWLKRGPHHRTPR